MNERGFTVGDLLIVVLILLISFFTVSKLKKNQEERAFKANLNSLSTYKSTNIQKV